MNDGINELDDLIQRAASTPWGKTCSELWAKAASMAEEQGDMVKAVRCYGELCAAYMMGGESTRVIAPFVWLDQQFKTHPEYFETQDINALGWYYKYVISTVRCVPTVPVAQCEAMLDEMKQYYMKHGDSMRAYYIRCYQFHRDLGNDEAAREAYVKWQNAEHSELADCERCDPGYEVLYHVSREQWEEAVRAGDKALAHDGEFCDSQPEALLTEMMEPWLRVGRDAEAWAAHIRAYRRYQQHPRYFEFLQDHWRYLALSGRAGRPERLERGMTILLRHMPWWTQAEHPRMLMDSAASAFVLLDSFHGEDRQRVLPTTLPGEGLAWAPRENLENPTIEQAAQWMKTLALDLAEQFDARPGLPAIHREVERIRTRMNVVAPDPLPAHNGLMDVTGLGYYESDIHIIRQLPTRDDATPDLSPAGTSAQHAEEGALSSDNSTDGHLGEDTQTHTEHNDADMSGETQASGGEDLPQIPLVITDEWKTMSAVELLEKSWSIARYYETIYFLELVFRVRQNPTLLDSLEDSVPEHLHPAWEHLVFSIRNAEVMEPLEPAWTPDSEDPAYELILQSQDALHNGRLFEAGMLADRATRTASGDPVGVRIHALALLSFAAKEAGYLDEAAHSAREAVNLSAMLGYENEQIYMMWILGVILRAQGKYVEAAEVAQNALDSLERYPQLWPIHMRVLELAATSNEKLEYFDAAGDYNERAARLLLAHGENLTAAAAFQEAAKSYEAAQAFTRVIDMCGAIVPIMKQQIHDVLVEMEFADPQEGDTYEAWKAQLVGAYRSLDHALMEYARGIVRQPGQVPEADIAIMEATMDEVLELRTGADSDKHFDKSIPWRHASWRSDYAWMLWMCYRYTAAVDEQRSSIEEFRALNDVVYTARNTLALAYMLHTLEDKEAAREAAQNVIDMLSADQFMSSADLSAARKLLRDIEKGSDQV